MIARLLHSGASGPVDLQGLTLRSGWPGWLLVVGLVVALAYAAWLYRRQAALSRRGRVALATARFAALGLLLFMLFQPALKVRYTVETPKTLVVLVDRSNSMTLTDTRRDLDDLVEAAIAVGQLEPDDPQPIGRYWDAADAMQEAADALAQSLDAQPPMRRALEKLRQLPTDDALAKLIDRQQQLLARAAAADAQAQPILAEQRDLLASLQRWRIAWRNADRSISEELKAQLATVTRGQLAERAARQTDGERPTRYFCFGRNLVPCTVEELQSPSPELLSRIGTGATHLGDAIRAAVEQTGVGNVAAVVIVTDGASNAGASPADAAQWLRQHDIPLIPVGIGAVEPDDLSLRGLMIPDVVFAGDLVTLRVQVHGSGYEKREAQLALAIDGMEVASRSITLGAGTQMEELSFKAPRTPGPRPLRIGISPMPGEATLDNNTLTRSIRVSDDKLRVLVIEGSPRWEYRYLRAVLKRDPRVEVQFITTEGDPDLARASKEHLARFPESPGEAFAYDLVILGDVRASVFTPTQLERIEQLVRDQGGSLILLAGQKHAPAEYVDTPIAWMLPVWVEAEKWETVSDDVYPHVTAEGRDSLIMQLDEREAKNQSLWSSVKPLRQVAPLLGPKPGAKVLAELSDAGERAAPYPLIAWQRYGAGKTMFVGTDSLWRLRERTGDRYHLRFWGQAIQFLTLSRLLGENSLVRIELDAPRGSVGAPVQVFAQVQTPQFEPAQQPTFPVQVTRAADGVQQAVDLKPMPSAPGLFHGVFTPTQPGSYTFKSADDQWGESNLTTFDTEHVDLEQRETAMQAAALEQLARATGGRLLDLRALPALPSLVPDEPSLTTVAREIELWDTTVLLILFITLLCAEWAWRRKRHLA